MRVDKRNASEGHALGTVDDEKKTADVGDVVILNATVGDDYPDSPSKNRVSYLPTDEETTGSLTVNEPLSQSAKNSLEVDSKRSSTVDVDSKRSSRLEVDSKRNSAAGSEYNQGSFNRMVVFPGFAAAGFVDTPTPPPNEMFETEMVDLKPSPEPATSAAQWPAEERQESSWDDADSFENSDHGEGHNLRVGVSLATIDTQVTDDNSHSDTDTHAHLDGGHSDGIQGDRGASRIPSIDHYDNVELVHNDDHRDQMDQSNPQRGSRATSHPILGQLTTADPLLIPQLSPQSARSLSPMEFDSIAILPLIDDIERSLKNPKKDKHD